MIVYTTVYECVGCGRRLHHNERYDDGGVCPYCGHREDDLRSIVQTKSVTICKEEQWIRKQWWIIPYYVREWVEVSDPAQKLNSTSPRIPRRLRP